MEFIKSLICACFIMGPALYFGYEGDTATMTVAVVAGAIASAFLNLNKFSKIKGLGFEAELEKLKHETYVTKEILRKLAIPLIANGITNITPRNTPTLRMHPDSKYEEFHRYLSLAKELELESSAELEPIIKKFLDKHIWLLFKNIASAISHNSDLYSFNKLYVSGSDSFPTKDQVIELAESFYNHDVEVAMKIKPPFEKLTVEQDELLEDYLYFVEHRSQRSQ